MPEKKHEQHPHINEQTPIEGSRGLERSRDRSASEQAKEQEKKNAQQTQQTTTDPIRTQAQQLTDVHAKDQEVIAIENILAEDMDDFFRNLNEKQQRDFKIHGEATALKIKAALQKQTTRVKDIIRLIVAWLRTLPGINRFFIEQEAKIKADKIIHFHKS